MSQPDPNPTIDKLRAILQAMQVPHVFDPTRKAELVDTAEQRVIAWALEAVPDNKPDDMTVSDVVNAHNEGYNQAIDDFRAKLTGGTE